ncbi:MAG: glycosyl hydrolase family 18 protein [Candidatus Moraniibacteriota bacterium]
MAKSLKIIFFFIILALLACGFFWLVQKNKINLVIKKEIANSLIVSPSKENSAIVQSNSAQNFFVAGWIPYWAKSGGAASLQEKIGLFSQFNLFAFGVSADGKLVDTAKSKIAPWPQFIADAKKQNVKIVPTILWGDAAVMHKIFADPVLRGKHVDNIVTMLAQNDFAGVDIDYEGKDVADRDNFSLFLETLHEKLQGKTLNCTVEARAQDNPPADLTGVRAMSWANDFSELNHYCDTVTIMAYDQVFQIHRAKVFEASGFAPSAPNADNAWAQENIEYSLKFIEPEKLILGVSTYGWEFSLQKITDGYRYTKVRSISYPDALALANSVDVVPTRTLGGELAFSYNAVDGQHLVTFDDAESVKDKIKLAKKFQLKGINLFKLDGLTDPKLFEILKNQ